MSKRWKDRQAEVYKSQQRWDLLRPKGYLHQEISASDARRQQTHAIGGDMDRKNQEELDNLFLKMHETLLSARQNAINSQRQEEQKEEDEKTYFLETRREYHPLALLNQLRDC